MGTAEFNYSSYNLLKQGAEGRIFTGEYLGRPVVVKERFVKKYRHPTLDAMLMKDRMKAEARALLRCKAAGVYTPAVYLVDFERRMIFMEWIKNTVTAKHFINFHSEEAVSEKVTPKCILPMKLDELMRNMGDYVGQMHSNHIIHGDLTTSNMITELESPRKIYFLDFGLSYTSQSVEDKAVDLYVLERALSSSHKDSKYLFDTFIISYMFTYRPVGIQVFNKLEEVRARGRKRTMVG